MIWINFLNCGPCSKTSQEDSISVPWDPPFSFQPSFFDFSPAICFTWAKRVSFNVYMFLLSSIFLAPLVHSFRVNSRKETFTVPQHLFSPGGESPVSLPIALFGFILAIAIPSSLQSSLLPDTWTHWLLLWNENNSFRAQLMSIHFLICLSSESQGPRLRVQRLRFHLWLHQSANKPHHLGGRHFLQI